MTSIHPYINFNGNCEAAFNHYRKVFGHDFEMISRFKDMPNPQQQPEDAEKIMHVSLPIGNGFKLFGSDVPSHYGKVSLGENISVSVNTASEEEATRIFNALAEGGKVTMPLEKTFWNAYFGMLVDAYGINWMVNYDYNQ